MITEYFVLVDRYDRYWIRPKRKDMDGFWSSKAPELQYKDLYTAGIWDTERKAEVYLKRMINSTVEQTRNTFIFCKIKKVSVS